MFVFGEERQPRRLGLPGVLVLVLVAVGVVAAVRWPVPPPSTNPPYASPAEVQAWRDDYGRLGSHCSVVSLIAVEGAKPSGEQIQRMQAESEARTCTAQIAADPSRVLLRRAQDWDATALAINATVDRVLCPAGAGCAEATLSGPGDDGPPTDADVAAVRAALTAAGHPEAEVRAEYADDNIPAGMVIYGVRLGGHACAVSFATAGRHAAPLGAVGAFGNGRCLSGG